jgi:hypothetical protein
MGPTAYPRAETSNVHTEQRRPGLCADELRCDAIARSGQRCSAPRTAGSTRCYWHDERLAEYRRLRSAEGGRTPRRNKLREKLADFPWGWNSPDDDYAVYEDTARRALALGQLSWIAYSELMKHGRETYWAYVREAREEARRAAEGPAETKAPPPS